MARYRPQAVLVIAILHLVGGGLGLVSGICGGAMQLSGAGQSFTGFTPPAQPGQKQPMSQAEMTKKMEEALERAVPGYKIAQYFELGSNVVLSSMMVAAGIGLLSMRSWARTLSIVYAILSILNHIWAVVWGVVFMMPGMNAMTAVMEEGMGPNAPKGMMSTIMTAGGILGVVFSALVTIYPIAVLIIMMRPHVVAAFRGEAPADKPDEGYDDRREDYDDRVQGEPDDRYRP